MVSSNQDNLCIFYRQILLPKPCDQKISTLCKLGGRLWAVPVTKRWLHGLTLGFPSRTQNCMTDLNSLTSFSVILPQTSPNCTYFLWFAHLWWDLETDALHVWSTAVYHAFSLRGVSLGKYRTHGIWRILTQSHQTGKPTGCWQYSFLSSTAVAERVVAVDAWVLLWGWGRQVWVLRRFR